MFLQDVLGIRWLYMYLFNMILLNILRTRCRRMNWLNPRLRRCRKDVLQDCSTSTLRSWGPLTEKIEAEIAGNLDGRTYILCYIS